MHLEVLRYEDAYRVLCHALGDGRVRAEQEAADELLRRCKGLPLTIRSAAAHLATRPRLPIGSYLEEVWSRDVVPPPSAGELRTLAPVTPAQTADSGHANLALSQSP
jgi:hypothetical protein